MDRGEEAGPSLTVTWSCPVGEPAAARYLCAAQLRERCQSQGETTTDPKQRCRLGRWRLRAKCPLAPLRGPCSLGMAAPGRAPLRESITHSYPVGPPPLEPRGYC